MTGQPEKGYWGLVAAPLAALDLCLALAALRGLSGESLP